MSSSVQAYDGAPDYRDQFVSRILAQEQQRLKDAEHHINNETAYTHDVSLSRVRADPPEDMPTLPVSEVIRVGVDRYNPDTGEYEPVMTHSGDVLVVAKLAFSVKCTVGKDEQRPDDADEFLEAEPANVSAIINDESIDAAITHLDDLAGAVRE